MTVLQMLKLQHIRIKLLFHFFIKIIALLTMAKDHELTHRL